MSLYRKSIVLAYWLTPLLLAWQSAQAGERFSEKISPSKHGVTPAGQSAGLSASLVRQSTDYYLRADGSRIHFLRKQGLYAVETRSKSSSAINRSKSGIENSFGDDVEVLESAQLGLHQIVKVAPASQTSKVQSTRSKASLVSTPAAIVSRLKAADSSISRVSPVFANSAGQGDILLLPKVTIKLATGANPNEIQRLATEFGLTVERQLRLPGHVYSATINHYSISAELQFALVRSIASEPTVSWVEPQFVSQPFKTQFVPSDPLFSDQWHLRNRGFRGSRCDTDCDADNAWDIDNANGAGAVSGDGMVIAVIDDGVQLDHPDLADNIWLNDGESCIAGTPNANRCNNGVDDDNNGFVDDFQGWDFVVDSASNPNLQNSNFDGGGSCLDGVDAQPGQDNDPSPQASVNCFVGIDPVEQDNHGTAVAGIAAAVQGNSQGVVGTAFSAEILPIRIISQFDERFFLGSFCTNIAEAIIYAGRHADVINNSWGINDTCMALEDAIADVEAGTIMAMGGNVSKRAGLGSPLIFSSGNSASGWTKVTVPVTAGEHAYEWRFLRDNLFTSADDGDRALLDDITWPSDSMVSVDFESGTLADAGFDIGNFSAGTACIPGCTEAFFVDGAAWSIQASPDPLSGGSQAAVVQAAGSDCGNTYLHILREEASAGELSFWVWVDTNTQRDKFEFLVDGREVFSFGDRNKFVGNSVAYPANLATTIAVGASSSGDLSGDDSQNAVQERRVFYSQFGSSLDLLAPSSDQHLGIATTDRDGAIDGFNFGQNTADFADTAYTNNFGGTSASAPAVAGIAAAILALDPSLDAEEVRSILRDSADKIGAEAYDAAGAGRNDLYGFGRANMFKALLLADDENAVLSDPAANCNTVPEAFDYDPINAQNDRILGSLLPISAEFCPALGELPASDDLCVPIKTSNNKLALICL